MDAYVFQAALYCEDCGERIREELAENGVEDSGDSDDFPQGPYPDGGGEADAHQHCDSGPKCLNAQVSDDRLVGAFLENPLTPDGLAYVQQAIAERPQSEVAQMWAEFYDVELPFPALDQTHVETWFERDRAHVALYDSRTGQVLAEWWDEDVSAAVEDGFLDPRDYHRSTYEHVAEQASAEGR